MGACLLAGIPASDDSMRALALQLGLAVRDAPIAKGLPGERLFLAAPRLRLSGESDAAWVPTVSLNLSARSCAAESAPAAACARLACDPPGIRHARPLETRCVAPIISC